MHIPREGTKQALLMNLLNHEKGANICELTEATGWKSNTVHSALSTLRASGYQIFVEEAAGEKRYQIRADRAS